MKSKITDKFQITIPKEIREKLKLSRNDFLEWSYHRGMIVIKPMGNSFFKHKNSVKTGRGSVKDDIALARKLRSQDRDGKNNN